MYTPFSSFPTPPLSDAENDVYFDDCLDLLYDRDFMPEEQLPLEIHELHSSLNKPVVPIKKSHLAPDGRMSKKERRTATRQVDQKARELLRPVTPPPAVREDYDYEGPEWNIIEDQALLTAVRNEELMCHTFEKRRDSIGMLRAQTCLFLFRSPRQCSIRYQMVIRPRESGQLMVIDPLTKKPRKVTFLISVHLRKGRVTTDLQYAHDADKLRESSILGRIRMIESLIPAQNAMKYARKPMSEEHFPLLQFFYAFANSFLLN
ncbi:unnamed protein product [Nippostrongylus brasiliensis]|uniref:MSP domain-containing protein n=1 Tax=Nippostrongylus brasiliensis TaxID=27835 RepID=A0A0N4XJA0_NIPBR|nr:unnamed protein product [Nippostrongylus brasiliensis]